MPTPVIVTAIFTPVEGRKDALVAALTATIPGVHAEQGCELYAIHDAADGTITMLEKWSSSDDLAAHSDSDAVHALQAAIDGLVVQPVVVTTMSPIPAGTREQGLV